MDNSEKRRNIKPGAGEWLKDARDTREGEEIGGGHFVFRRTSRTGRCRLSEWPFEHPTFQAACDERDRLAEKYPKDKFVVFSETRQNAQGELGYDPDEKQSVIAAVLGLQVRDLAIDATDKLVQSGMTNSSGPSLIALTLIKEAWNVASIGALLDGRVPNPVRIRSVLNSVVDAMKFRSPEEFNSQLEEDQCPTSPTQQ